MTTKLSRVIPGTYVTPIIGSMTYVITDDEPGCSLVTVLDEWVIVRALDDRGAKRFWVAVHTSHIKNDPSSRSSAEAMTMLEIIADYYDATIIKIEEN